MRLVTNFYTHDTGAASLCSYFFSNPAIEKNREAQKKCKEAYHYGFNGQMKTNEWAGIGNHYVFKYREQDPRTGRFISVDPIAHLYPWNSPYAFAENDVIRCMDWEGLEKVYMFDQGSDPKNKRVYTAKVYVVTKDNVVHGPYSGSTFPNDATKQNTLKTGTYDYNNKSGHKGGTLKGLNIVDDKGNRTAPGTSPSSKNVTMTDVNVHSGQKPSDNPSGLENRGSAGCQTIKPDEAGGFFSNFDWSGKNGTTGKAEGTISVFRGETPESAKAKADLNNGKDPGADSKTTATPANSNQPQAAPPPNPTPKQ